MKPILSWACALVVAFVLDMIWLGWAGPNFFRPAIGHLMADKLSMVPAALFYPMYAAGIVWFVLRHTESVGGAAAGGLALGLLCYGTFDLTNQAIMQGWPWRMTVIDMAWGMTATALTSAVTWWVTKRFFA